MRKLYQFEWHGIKFTSFASTSPFHLANADFYSSFYKKFFDCYHKKDDLSAKWLSNKIQVADFISKTIRHPNEQILSLGCGLGVIEEHLLNSGITSLDITETSDIPLRWIKSKFAPEKIHIGNFPECIKKPLKFDTIYLSAIDYCFNQKEWIKFLSSLKAHLKPNGRCLIISVSFDHSSPNILNKLAATAKDWTKILLHISKIQDRGQFWGYLRSRNDYFASFKHANFIQIKDGWINSDNYWIEGRS